MSVPIKLKIVSWNINGIKSFDTPLKKLLTELDSDIICFQEVKCSKKSIESENAIVDGFNSYFSFCERRAGYSGVAVFCRNPVVPDYAHEGLTKMIKQMNKRLPDDLSICEHLNITNEELVALECEGRAVCCQFSLRGCKCQYDGDGHSLVVINVYCPMAEIDNNERQHYKEQFHKLLLLAAQSILDSNNHVVITGDLNVSHRDIDTADKSIPKNVFLGYSIRHWFDNLLVPEQRWPSLQPYKPKEQLLGAFVDSFRHIHGDITDRYSCWCAKQSCRLTNFGSRIDFVLVDYHLSVNLCDADVCDTVLGSDHCPVSAIFDDLRLLPATAIPALCSSNLQRFRTQQRITAFLIRSERPQEASLPPTKPTAIQQPKEEIDSMVPKKKARQLISNEWQAILKGPPKPPLCNGHNEKCVLRTAGKQSKNSGKQFWSCNRPKGQKKDPESGCDFFMWKSG